MESLDFDRPENWERVSRAALGGWLVFYCLFLLHAAASKSGFLILDYVNLIIHEGGHFFFSYYGYTIMILGGTLGELLVPLLCGVYFVWHRQTTAVAFSAFWFFENFLYIGVYMSDARTGNLPLVGSEVSDWEILFTKWNLMARDTMIGGLTRKAGWLGMLAAVAWLAWMFKVQGSQVQGPTSNVQAEEPS